MNLIAYALTKIRTPKGALGQMSSHFRRPSDKQYGKRSKTLLKSALQHLYHIS